MAKRKSGKRRSSNKAVYKKRKHVSTKRKKRVKRRRPKKVASRKTYKALQHGGFFFTPWQVATALPRALNAIVTNKRISQPFLKKALSNVS